VGTGVKGLPADKNLAYGATPRIGDAQPLVALTHAVVAADANCLNPASCRPSAPRRDGPGYSSLEAGWLRSERCSRCLRQPYGVKPRGL
jgi:hypothetical protein